MSVPKKVALGASQVTIEWGDGHTSVHSNGRLREACPCAICVGEPPAIGVSRAIPLMVAAPEGVLAERYSLVGRYAIAFAWSDGHSSGIYSYGYLIEMCECESCAEKAAGRRADRGGIISEGRR